MARKEWIIAYHGTSTDPQIILSQGLKPLNFRQTANQVLIDYYPRRIPKWVYKAINRELRYRQQNQKPFVHLTLSWNQALAYTSADEGEFKSIIRGYVREGLRLKKKRIKEKRYIVTVKILMDEDKYVRECKARMSDHGIRWLEGREWGCWDVQVKNVPPARILRIEDVTHLAPFFRPDI